MTAVSEIVVFGENSRGIEKTYRSLIQGQLIDRLGADLGVDAAIKAKAGFASLKRLGGDGMQLRYGDRRIRLKVAA